MITAIIQARMNSSRLPGKVLAQFSGNTLLGHIVDRVMAARSISDVVVATTTNPADDQLVEWLLQRKIKYLRGDENDVLKRYFDTAKSQNANHIARITSDDPFKDPRIIDDVADMYFSNNLDFACNNNPPSFAEGLDTEIFSFDALSSAKENAVDPFEREHVTQHFYRNPQNFRQKNLLSPIDYSHLRWTIDTEQDLIMARTVYQHLFRPGHIFLSNEILSLIKDHPEIPLINEGVKRSDMYKKLK